MGLGESRWTSASVGGRYRSAQAAVEVIGSRTASAVQTSDHRKAGENGTNHRRRFVPPSAASGGLARGRRTETGKPPFRPFRRVPEAPPAGGLMLLCAMR